MNTLIFLEKMANDLHYSSTTQSLVATQSIDIRTAFSLDDAENIKHLFNNKAYQASSCAVVQI